MLYAHPVRAHKGDRNPAENISQSPKWRHNQFTEVAIKLISSIASLLVQIYAITT